MEPKTTILSDREMFDIDQASRALLWEVGTLAENDEAMDYFEKAGAVVDRTKKLVRIPNHVINETLAKCASSVRLYDRKGGEPLIIGGDRVYYGTVGIATNVLDFETNEYRQVICDDLRDIVRLSDVLDPPDFILVPATPTDVPSETVDLIETKILLTNTSKHFIAEAQNRKNCLKNIEMAVEFAGSLEALQEKPFFSTLVTLSSPLHFRNDGVELIVECAKHGLPLFIESGPMCGGTSPATLASTIVTANAELLSSFVLAKAVNPAVPLIYASWARILDMRAATCSHGGPEFGMLRIGTSQMAKYYGLPCGGGGILADTKSIDVQLGMEKLGTGLLPALANTNMIVGMGLFADENAISLETLVIDNEIAQWIKRVKRGIEVNDESLDLSIFKEVGPGGDFVRTKHTRNNFKKEMFLPNVMDRGFLALDKDPEAKSMRKRARNFFYKAMESYIPPKLPENINEKLDAIINR
ncbi:trimethylamine methyltransferase family protein [Desulfocicer niacini]